MNRQVSRIISRIDRRKLQNNTQRALLRLLEADGQWVARTQVRLPSASARLRDLRKDEFGGFEVECVPASVLDRPTMTRSTKRATFYRVNPASVTAERVTKLFEGVI